MRRRPRSLARALASLVQTFLAVAPPFVVAPVCVFFAATPAVAETTGANTSSEAYLAALRAALPDSWLQKQFRRDRDFPALARSRQLVAKGRDREAAQVLQGYLKSDPKDLVIEFEYLSLMNLLKQYHAAIDAADRILATVPGFGPAQYYRGLAWAALGKYQQALSDLSAAAASGQLSPADALYAQRSLAQAALASQKPQKALAILHRATASKARPTLLVAQGQIFERLGRIRDAAEAYDEAAKGAGSAADRSVAGLFGAELALKRDDAAGALARAQAAWDLLPSNRAARVLADAASRMSRPDLIFNAQKVLTRAGKLNRATQMTFANAFFRAKQYRAAADGFATLAKTAKEPKERYRLEQAAGFAAEAGGEPASALVHLQQAAALDPTPKALSSVVEVAIKGGRLDVAASALRRLSESSIGRNRDRALERLSAVEEQLGDAGAALAALRQVPANERDVESESRAARLAAKLGDREAAASAVRALMRLPPTRPNLRALGEAQLSVGMSAEAIQSLRKALALGSDDAGLREMLGNALLAAGKPARAADAFDVAAATAAPAEASRLRLASGFALLKAGEKARAFTRFQQAVALEPTTQALAAAAGAAEEIGRPAEAARYFAQLTRRAPTATHLRMLGAAQLASKEPSAAVESFRKALALHPQDDRALREMLANALMAAGQPAAAAAEFAKLAETAQQPANAYRLRLSAGFAALKAGDSAAALASFQQAARLKPTPEALKAAAETALASGQFVDAARALQRLAKNPDPAVRARFLTQLSVVYEKMGNPRAAERVLEQLPSSVRNKPATLRREAVLAQKLGDRKLLLARLRALAVMEPTLRNRVAIADAEIAAGEVNAAATSLRTLLAIKGLSAAERARFLERLANIEAARGRPGEARTLFAEAYHLSPNHPPRLLAQAAVSAGQAGNRAQAVEDYRALTADRRLAGRLRAKYAHRLGELLVSMARNAQALSAYEEAARLGGATPALDAQIGTVLLRLHRATDAAAKFQEAYTLQPRADYALSLGYAYQAAGKPGLAIVFLRRALAQSRALSVPQRREAEAALGYAYSETGQNLQAATYFEKALSSWPTPNHR